jgi:hypothetical protein
MDIQGVEHWRNCESMVTKMKNVTIFEMKIVVNHKKIATSS